MFFGFLFDTLYSRNHFPGKVGEILGTIFKFFSGISLALGFVEKGIFVTDFSIE